MGWDPSFSDDSTADIFPGPPAAQTSIDHHSSLVSSNCFSVHITTDSTSPGEILPQIPAATHGEAPLKPYTSVQSVLSSIPRPHPERRQDPLHRLSAVAHTKDLPYWDASGILPRAMTTSGGQNYHPSGKRDLTLREYATLQGFPACHIFEGKLLKKQIGNAVPPCVATVLFESIKRDLDAADGILEEPELIE